MGKKRIFRTRVLTQFVKLESNIKHVFGDRLELQVAEYVVVNLQTFFFFGRSLHIPTTTTRFPMP